MSAAPERRNRIAAWYERVRHPRWVLAGLIALLYAHALPTGFFIDDYRHIGLLKSYAEGERSTLGLYRFLVDPETNRAERVSGHYPWWIGDDVRYQHARPVAEWVLYGEYRIWGERAWAFRVVNLALYALGVGLVLRLFRVVSADERVARWGALVYAVAAAHAVPVVFVASQADVLALVLCVAVMLLVARFVAAGGAGRVAAALGLYAIALGAKEASLPLAVLPFCVWLPLRDRRGSLKRAMVASGLLLLVGLVWLAWYARGGYGANNSIMLDPLRAPVDYLMALPGRAVLLLSTWFNPINPFLFYFRPAGRVLLWASGVIGAIGLAVLAVYYWRHHRGQRGVAAMALWVLPFIPLLACTVPDDRVMMLPSVGFAFLGAVWLTRPRADGSLRLRVLPLLLFVVFQVAAAEVATVMVGYARRDTVAALRATIAQFGRPVGEGDYAFYLNATRDWRVLFAQQMCDLETDESGLRVAYLSEAEAPEVTVVDSHTLRIAAREEPLFASFLGDMAVSRDEPKREGDVFETDAFEGRIARVEDGAVRAVTLRFKQPLTSERYRFFVTDEHGQPALWRPGEMAMR